MNVGCANKCHFLLEFVQLIVICVWRAFFERCIPDMFVHMWYG